MRYTGEKKKASSHIVSGKRDIGERSIGTNSQ
jgi:hypothetical protein